MIILDWDKIGHNTMMKRIEHIKTYDFIKSILICQSPSLDGYHIYIEEFWFINPTMRYRLRLAWHDDKGRLIKDMLVKKSPLREVSFNYKMKNEIKFHEVKILKYYRKNSSSEWQVKNQNPKFQTKKSKVELLQ